MKIGEKTDISCEKLFPPLAMHLRLTPSLNVTELDDRPRDALFLSHANPEDNDVTLWLGSKLAAEGYNVWADILKLRGGDDWERCLEEALRHRALKMLLIGTPIAMAKQGVRNEIHIATEVARKIGDENFIIPLRIEPYESTFRTAHAQYIDFSRSWALGLRELLTTLDETYNIPKVGEGIEPVGLPAQWQSIQTRQSRAVVDEPEPLLTNWLSIKEWPDTLYIYMFKDGVSERAQKRALSNVEWPYVPHGAGLITFAIPSVLNLNADEQPMVRKSGEISTEDFLDDGWQDYGIHRSVASRHIVSLLRQGLKSSLLERGMEAFAMSDFSDAWFHSIESQPSKMVPFDFGDVWKGRRQITGYSEKREMYWHYGVSLKPKTFPFPHIRVVGRVIFTPDGKTPVAEPKKMHGLRRSFAKTWRNNRWRDMMLAMLSRLEEKDECDIAIDLGGEYDLLLETLPISIECPRRPETIEEQAGNVELNDDDADTETDEDNDIWETLPRFVDGAKLGTNVHGRPKTEEDAS